jgi:hypothetical protein
LNEIQACAKFVDGDRSACHWPQLDPHLADLHLPVNDEAKSDRARSRRAFFNHFYPRIRHPSRLKQR